MHHLTINQDHKLLHNQRTWSIYRAGDSDDAARLPVGPVVPDRAGALPGQPELGPPQPLAARLSHTASQPATEPVTQNHGRLRRGSGPGVGPGHSGKSSRLPAGRNFESGSELTVRRSPPSGRRHRLILAESELDSEDHHHPMP